MIESSAIYEYSYEGPLPLFIVGGINGDGVRLDSTEALDVSNNSLTCQPTEPYLHTVENAVSFLDGDGSPVVCGGSFADGDISDACFVYPEGGDHLWTPVAVMNKPRRWAAGVQLDENRYWITGTWCRRLIYLDPALF